MAYVNSEDGTVVWMDDENEIYGSNPNDPANHGTVWTPGLIDDLAASEYEGIPTSNTATTGGATVTPGTKTPEQIAAEGKAADDAAGRSGGYMLNGAWVPGSPRGSGAGGGGMPAYQPSASYGGLAPFQQGQYAFPQLDLPEYREFEPFQAEEWNAPKPSEIGDDPSYQFRFEEGLRPIRNSRAAQGLTRTGATLKALSQYGQNFASNEFGRIYDRAADSYDRRNSSRHQAWSSNRQAHLDSYDRRSNEAAGEYAPRQRWAELQFGRDFDLYKYQNDDSYRRWAKQGDWTSNMAQPVDE